MAKPKQFVRAARLLALVLPLAACSPEKPPQAEDRGSPTAAIVPSTFAPEADKFVITYAGDKGQFADCTTIAEVPADARARVGVNVFGKPPPPGQVWVTNLDAPSPDGRYALEAIPRDEFEESVLGIGRASAVELPELPAGVDPSDIVAAPEGPVIVYKTSWCGVCKQLEAYLDRKGVAYVAKDIEKDLSAAAELKAKADKAGVPMGSVPMIDVGGELLRGFDRNRLEKLL